jgi:hypothetical protein
LSISIRIKASIEHINALDDAKFKKLLQRIAEKAGRQVRWMIYYYSINDFLQLRMKLYLLSMN